MKKKLLMLTALCLIICSILAVSVSAVYYKQDYIQGRMVDAEVMKGSFLGLLNNSRVVGNVYGVPTENYYRWGWNASAWILNTSGDRVASKTQWADLPGDWAFLDSNNYSYSNTAKWCGWMNVYYVNGSYSNSWESGNLEKTK